jgi:hypothetical protein
MVEALRHHHEQLQQLADNAGQLADEFEIPGGARGALRDLLQRELLGDLDGDHVALLRLDMIIDDIAAIVTAPYTDDARALSSELQDLAYACDIDEDARENEERRRAVLCLDCGADTIAIAEFYMVRDEVWAQVAEPDEGMLCVGCCEKRLGRRLVPDDFTDCVFNHGHRSARLRARVLGLEEAPAV